MNRLILAGALLALTGCNATQGLGKDLQQVGGVITGTAQGVQNGTMTSGQTTPRQTTPSQTVPAPGETTPTNCQPDANGLVLEGCPKSQ